ncbi:MAG: TrkA family potassium uptake protein [Oscillospiraceae bacterium]
MYVIIAGCGRVGSNLALRLSENGYDVAVIDKSSANFSKLGTGFNGLTISGIPIDEDVLRSAGIEKADAVAAVTPDDNMNIMIGQIAKKLYSVAKVTVRVTDPQRVEIIEKLGFSTVCPTQYACGALAEMLTGEKL